MQTKPTDRPSSHDIVIRIDSLEQIFNAPDLNPFSERDIDVLGEAALLRMVKRLLAKGWRRRQDSRLVFELPPDQITPDLQTQVGEAVRRYCLAKIEDNALVIRMSRNLALVELGLVALILVGLALVGAWLWGPISANATEAVQGVLIGLAGVFVWVVLWDPMEKLLFEWVQPAQENRILHGLMELEILVKAWAESHAAAA
jgi:hypothetical protein